MQSIHQGARWSLGQNSGNAANGQRDPHALLVPPVASQVDREKRSDAGLHVSQEEVQPIQALKASPGGLWHSILRAERLPL
jgi:hypothetical protein